MRFVLFLIVAVVGSNPPGIPRESPTVKRIVLYRPLKGLTYALAIANGIGTGYQAGRDEGTPTLLRALQGLHFASTLGSVGLTANVEGGKQAAKEFVLSGLLYGGSKYVAGKIRSPKASPAEDESAGKAVDTPTTSQEPYSHEVEAAKLITRYGELLEEMKKEALSGEGKTDSRELQLKLARLDSDYGKLFYSSIKDEQVRGELLQRIFPSFGALRRQFYEMGGDEKFPMMWPQYQLYNIVNGINHFAQMSPKEQADNMWMLRNLGSQYPSILEEATGIAGLDRTEFDAAGQTLRQLQAQYSRSLK